MTAGFVGSPLTYIAMRSGGAWFSVAIGFGMYVLSFLLSLVLPSSRQATPKKPTRRDSRTEEPTSTRRVSKATRMARFNAVLRDQFLSNKRLGALLCSLFVLHLGRSCTRLLKQYVTGRYEWSWSEVRRTGLTCLWLDKTFPDSLASNYNFFFNTCCLSGRLCASLLTNFSNRLAYSP